MPTTHARARRGPLADPWRACASASGEVCAVNGDRLPHRRRNGAFGGGPIASSPASMSRSARARCAR